MCYCMYLCYFRDLLIALLQNLLKHRVALSDYCTCIITKVASIVHTVLYI